MLALTGEWDDRLTTSWRRGERASRAASVGHPALSPLNGTLAGRPGSAFASEVVTIATGSRFLLTREGGVQLGQGGEVLGAAGGAFAADDVLERGDRDLEPLAERLVVGGSLEILVPSGAVRVCGDVKLAGVGGEVQDLGACEQPWLGGEGDGRLTWVDTDRGVQLLERGGEALEVGLVGGGGDVDVAGDYLNAG